MPIRPVTSGPKSTLTFESATNPGNMLSILTDPCMIVAGMILEDFIVT